MAVTYGSFIIGGSSGSDISTRIDGPFPRYNISSESNFTDSGDFLSTKHSITVTGTLTIPTWATANITTKGQRQSVIQKEINKALSARTSSGNDDKATLTIEAYGGLGNQIVFTNARLLSVEIPDQTDESAGVQNQEYSFSFEAYDTTSGSDIVSGSETWDATRDDARIVDNASEQEYTFTITHTVEATGVGTGGSTAVDNAKAWVTARAGTGAGAPDIGQPGGTYNHVTSANSNTQGGTYSQTDTWVEANGSYSSEIDISTDSGESGITSITVNGTIQGLDSSGASSRLANAKTGRTYWEGKAFTLASAAYNVTGGTLQSTVVSSAQGENRGAGSVSFTRSYNDIVITIPGAIAETIDVTYDNPDQNNKIMAIIQVMNRANGPIFQDMQTTPERKKGLSVDATMGKQYRTAKPTFAWEGYAPTDGHRQTFNESWSSSTGKYTLSVEWVY